MSGILILGSTGPTGEILTRRCCEAGRRVAVVHRAENRRAEYETLGAAVIAGDAFERDGIMRAVEAAAATCDTVVNLIGGNPFHAPETWPDLTGNVNAIDAAVAAGIGRFIFVTSVGTGASWQYVPDGVDYLRPILKLKTAAEEHLKRTGLDWTIVKPGGLGPPDYKIRNGNPLVTENPSVRGLIDRTDLATVIERVIGDTGHVTRHRELYAVVDRIEVLEGEATPFHWGDAVQMRPDGRQN